jgi:phage shock protein PspC (stress-responsive transcriptional regulator)
MQKVIAINLNGNAYQVDERGYDALVSYLDAAQRQLRDNPDRVEIIADLEQAIAEKCQRFLNANKTVVTSEEVDRIIREMGPVDGGGATAAGNSPPGASAEPKSGAHAAPRRLYRIPDGAMIAGVCNGLAAYFRVDVTLVRIAFVLAAVLTKGVALLLYVLMMFIVPEATTAEERAAAGSAPFNAKEIIDRARRQYARGQRHWRRQWRRQQRHWRREWPPAAPVAYAPSAAVLALMPIFAILHLALFVTMMAMLMSLVNTGGILSWRLPPDVPLWAGMLILLVGYQIVVSPIRAAHHWRWVPQASAPAHWLAFWNAVIWMIGLAVMVWIASSHVPEIREFLQRLPDVARDFGFAMRDLFDR